MMNEQNEKVTRIERTRFSDDLVFTKEIIEQPTTTKHKILGIETKDFIDMVIKIIGIASVVIAILNYTNEQKSSAEAKAEKAHAQLLEERKLLEQTKKELKKEYQDSLQRMVDNNRTDSAFKIKQIELEYAKLRDQRDYDQRNRLFQQQWLNSFEQLKIQKREDRRDVSEKFDLELYRDITRVISDYLQDILTAHTPENFDHRQMNDLISRVKLTKDDSLGAYLESFKSYYDSADLYVQLNKDLRWILYDAKHLFGDACNHTSIARVKHRDTFILKFYNNSIANIKKRTNEFFAIVKGLPSILTDSVFMQKANVLNELNMTFANDVERFKKVYDEEDKIRIDSRKDDREKLMQIAENRKQLCESYDHGLRKRLAEVEQLNSLAGQHSLTMYNFLHKKQTKIHDYMYRKNLFLNN